MSTYDITLEQIETPALLVDLDVLEENINKMENYLKDKSAMLRPHFKTHKCTEIAKMQLAAGAKGITCAKLSEAEVLAAASVKDILIANQVVDTQKLHRLAGIARSGKITVCVDNPLNISDVSHAAQECGSTVHILIEIDIGMNRCGINTGEEAYQLAEQINNSPGLVFDGFQAYAGQISHEADYAARTRGVAEAISKVAGIKKYLTEKGIDVKEISGASTGTYNITGDNTIWTEIQAGSYIFMDTDYERLGTGFKNALTVQTTVINKRPGMAITDAGQKVCCITKGLPTIKGYPDLFVKSLNEEHGKIIDEKDILLYLQKIEYIPSHCCSTVNLHDHLYGIRKGKLEKTLSLDGRGKSR